MYDTASKWALSQAFVEDRDEGSVRLIAPATPEDPLHDAPTPHDRRGRVGKAGSGKEKRGPRPGRGIARHKADLRALIEEALEDAYGDEQPGALLSMLQDEVDRPFKARAFGMAVEVQAFDTEPRSEAIVAICRVGRKKYRVLVTELEWDPPGPKGVERIEAYKAWLSGEA
jgi:hypothetical protein